MFAAILIVCVVAQCSGGACPPSPTQAQSRRYLPAAPATHRMVDDSGQAWDSADLDALRAHVATRNAAILAARRPDGPAPATAPAIPPASNYGLSLDKIPHVNQSWYGGNADPPMTAAAAAVERTKRLHLTAVGPNAETVREAWYADPAFAAIAAELGDGLAVQAFAADNPLVADIGLKAGGAPDVVLQDESGKVLYRAKADPGPAKLVGELRKRDPAYDPTKDPDGEKKSGDGSPFGDGLNAASITAAAVMIFLILRKRRG